VALTPVDGPRPEPNTLINSPGETGPGRKLAPLRMERTNMIVVEPLMVSVTARLCAGLVPSVGVTVTIPE